MKCIRQQTISVEHSQQAAWSALLLAIAVFHLTGCEVGPNYHPPAAQAPPAYKEIGDWKPAQPNDQNLGGTWWTIFQDPQLDALELQVNVSNQNLKAAEAQYRQSRAVLRYSRADLYPTVTVGPSATRERISSNRPPPTSIFDGITYNDYILPFDFSYQLDVWGRVRRMVESSREQAQASAADLATVNLSMHADLALDYFQARSLDAEEQLLKSTVTQYEQALQLIQSQFKGGIASEVEVEQAKTQLKTVQAAAIDVGVMRAQYEHAVAILIGKPPAEFSLPPLPLTDTASTHSCRPALGTAGKTPGYRSRGDGAWPQPTPRSELRSRLTIHRSIWAPREGSKAPALRPCSVDRADFGLLGESALMTVFDVGRRRALTDQAIAAYDYQVAAYRENVLTGFQQVEDNLAAVRILENEARVQDEAVVAAERSLELSIKRYNGGVTSYLEVIVAQNAALSDEVTAVNILGTADGEHGLTDPGSWWRMGSLKSAGATGMLRQASQQQFQLNVAPSR